jgi:hypothetical protein
MPDLMASGGNSGAHRRLMYARGNHLNCKRVNLEGRQEVATKQLEQFVLVALHGPYTVEQNFRRHLCTSRTFLVFYQLVISAGPYTHGAGDNSRPVVQKAAGRKTYDTNFGGWGMPQSIVEICCCSVTGAHDVWWYGDCAMLDRRQCHAKGQAFRHGR